MDLLGDFFEVMIVLLIVLNCCVLSVEFINFLSDFFEFMVDDEDIIDKVCKGFVNIGVVIRFNKSILRWFLIIGDKYIV